MELEPRVLPPLLGQVRGKRLLDVCCSTGRWLRRRKFLEPHFAEPERHFFADACKPWLFDEVRGKPALLVCRWGKGGV